MGRQASVERLGGTSREDKSLTETRERTPRADSERWERRRRQPGSLDRMVATNLGIPEEWKDPEYHYHWINDVRGQPHLLATQDDYDIVTIDELEANARKRRADFAFNREAFGGDGNKVSTVVERDGTRAILMKKPKDFYDHDYEEMVRSRQAMMESRVYHGDVADDAGTDDKPKDYDGGEFYVPKGNTLGGAAPRRRGRIPNRLK